MRVSADESTRVLTVSDVLLENQHMLNDPSSFNVRSLHLRDTGEPQTPSSAEKSANVKEEVDRG